MSTDADRSTAPTDGDPPRDPSAYRPALHFAERFKDNYDEHNRHLDGEIIDGCIKRGEASSRHGDTYWFRETFGGVTYRLTVNVAKREVVTGQPISINTEAAAASGRWSTQQIEDIREFLAAKHD